MTIKELLTKGPEVARDERELLLAHALHAKKEWIVAHPETLVAPAAVRRHRGLLARRTEGEPFAYVIGEKWFYGRAFKVNKDVLIPRPATETIIEAALPFVTLSAREGSVTVLDVGTGSGAIAITLAAAMPQARVIGIDVSAAALRVARANAKRLGVSVLFKRMDVLQPNRSFAGLRMTRGGGMTKGALIIAANLPYLRTNDLKTLDRSITSYEPRLALASGKDGLDHYRAFMQRIAEAKLQPDLLLLEADPPQMDALSVLVQLGLPAYRIGIQKDLAGNARVLVASK